MFQVGLRGLTEPVDLLRDHCSGRITPCCESNHYFVNIRTIVLFNCCYPSYSIIASELRHLITLCSVETHNRFHHFSFAHNTSTNLTNTKNIQLWIMIHENGTN
jgi:hypothetical protein